MFTTTPGPAAKALFHLCAFAILGISLFVLIHGWWLGNDNTVRLRPDFPAIVPSTAACFALLALALLEQLRLAWGALSHATPVLLGAVGAVSLVNLFVLGAEALHLTTPHPEEPRLHSDHMSLATSLGLLLCTACIALMRRTATSEAVTYLGLFGLASSLGALIGPCINPRIFNENLLFNGLSLPTALLFSLVFTALLIYQNGPRAREMEGGLPG